MPERAGGPALVCVGNATLDEARHADGRREVTMGGDALYSALAARWHASDVRVLAPLGEDVPAATLAALSGAGLDLSPSPRRSAPTIRTTITYAADGTRTWGLPTGEEHFEAMSVQPGDVDAACLGADGVLVTAMGLRAQLALVPWWRERSDAAVLVDLREDYLTGHLDALRAMAAHADVLLPSEVEALALSGTGDPVAAATALLDLGPRVVVVKRAELGALVATRARGARTTSVPAAPLDERGLVDPTGAGDAFAGAFAAAHLAGADPVEAARAGAATAAHAVMAAGWSGLLHPPPSPDRCR